MSTVRNTTDSRRKKKSTKETVSSTTTHKNLTKQSNLKPKKSNKVSSKSPPFIPPPGKTSPDKRLSWESKSHRLEINPNPAQNKSRTMHIEDLSTTEDDEVRDMKEEYNHNIDRLLKEVSLKREEKSREHLNASRRLIEDQEEEIMAYKKDLDITVKDYDKAKRSLDALNHEVELSRTEAELLSKEKKKLLKKLSEVEIDGRETSMALEKMKDTCKKLKREQKNVSFNKRTIIEEKNILHKQLESVEESNYNLRNLLKEAQKRMELDQQNVDKCEILMNRLVEAEAKIQNQTTELAEKNKKIDCLTSQVEADKYEVRALDDLHKNLETTRAQLQNTIRNKESENERLSIRVKKMEEQSNSATFEVEHYQGLLAATRDKSVKDKEMLKKAARLQRDRAVKQEEINEELQMAENNAEDATSFPGNLSQNLPDPQNPASIDAFEEFVYEDNDEVFQVRGYTYWSMEKSDSWKKTHEFVEGDRIQKTLSASRDSGIDGLHTEGNGANFEPPPQTSDLPMSDPANDSSHVELLADDSKHDNVPVNNEAPDESEEHTYERPDRVLFEGRSRLSTNSWQKRELRSIEEIELYKVEQTLKIFDKLKIVRRDSLRMDGMLLVGKDEKYFVSRGLKAFEARKLYKYVRGWRPKDHQQCNKDPFSTTINRWSTGDVQTVMQSLKLPQVGDFAVANQVDGLLLMDLVENKYMIDIEKDYGVKLSLLEYERLVPFLEEKKNVADALAELETAKSTLQQLTDVNAQLKSERDSVTEDLGVFKRNVMEIADIIELSSKSVQAGPLHVVEKLVSKVTRLKNCKTENENHKITIKELEDRLESTESIANNKIAVAETEVKQLKSAIDQYEVLTADYKIQLKKHREESESLKMKLEKLDRDSQRQLQGTTNELHEVRNALHNKTAEMEPYPDLLKTCEIRLQDAQERALQAEKRSSDHSRVITDITQKLEVQSEELEKFRTKYSSKSDQYKSLTEQYQELQKCLRDNEVTHRELLQSLGRKDENIQNLQTSVQEQKAKNDRLVLQLEAALEDSRRQFEAQKETNIAKERTGHARIIDLEAQLSRSTQHTEQIKRDKEEAERKFNTRLQDMRDRLEQANNTTKSMQTYVHFLKSTYANVFSDDFNGDFHDL